MSLATCQLPGGASRRTDTAKVLSCVATPKEASGKAPARKGKAAAPAEAAAPTFDVLLTPTILFPEGGGQPSDHGTLTCDGIEARVTSVLRTPSGVLHRVDRELPVDSEVQVQLDWERRWSHMQQHSAQHLISAVAVKHASLKTLSWWLASHPAECHIELDAPSVTAEQLQAIEAQCNEHIRAAAPMKLHMYESLAAAKQDELFMKHMQKTIPESQEGAIRVIEIESLDFNPCCGTHLSSAAQLQAVKLTRVEKGKSSCKLFFLAGERLLLALGAALDVQRSLTAALSCGPEHFDAKVKAMQAELKAGAKALAAARAELAAQAAQELVRDIAERSAKVACFHREEANLAFISEVSDAANDALQARAHAAPFLLLCTASDDTGGAAGAFLLLGDEARVAALGPELAAKLGGKGGGRKGRFQGKASSMDAKSREEVKEWLQQKMDA